MSTWTARHARYPYCRSQDLWTRFHLLNRKVARQGGTPTLNDKRAARILGARMCSSLPPSPRESEALGWLSVIADG